VELLVVISITILLVALLLPSLGAARIASQCSQSLSNIRQVQFSVFTYAEDNKTSFPLSRYGYFSASATFLPSWPGHLYHRGRYISSIQVLWSPARDRSMLGLEGMKSSMHSSDWYYPGYALNAEMVAQLHETTLEGAALVFTSPIHNYYKVNGKHPLRLSQRNLPPPTRFLMSVDGWSNSTSYVNGIAGHYEIAPGNIWNNPNAGTLPFNYNGAVPHGFLDGHAKATDGSDIGWRVGAASPVGAGVVTRAGPYVGNWTYTTGNPVCAGEPWYQFWRMR
jgi:type II secretory pathway pseudopilin PulG